MVRVLSFPLRVGLDGSFATVEQNSDQHVEEEIAIAMLTRPGERIQAPTFGVADPAYVGFEVSALQRHLLDFGPSDVTITGVAINQLADREEVRITWARSEDAGEQGVIV